MQIEYLLYLNDFAQTLSITKTARNFFMTPQGISRSLHLLEKEYGVTLIIREKNKVTLTEAGLLLARDAKQITECYVNTFLHLANIGPSFNEAKEDKVQVLTTILVSKHLTPLLQLHLPGRFPFDVSVRESDIFKVLSRTAYEKSPHFFSFISFPETDRFEQLLQESIENHGLIYTPLCRIPIQLLVSKESPLAERVDLSLSNIKEYPIIVHEDPALYEILEGSIDELNILIATSELTLITQELSKSNAVAPMPRIASVRGLPSGSILKSVKGLPYSKVGILASEMAMSNQNVNMVIDYIIHFFKYNRNRKVFKGTFEMID